MTKRDNPRRLNRRQALKVTLASAAAFAGAKLPLSAAAMPPTAQTKVTGDTKMTPSRDKIRVALMRAKPVPGDLATN